MIYVLLESKDSFIKPVLSKIIEKTHPSCRATVTKSTQYEIIKSYKQPPLLASGWLLRVSADVTASQLKILAGLPDNNVILFHVTSRKALNDVIEKLTTLDVDIKVIDNYTVSRQDMITYVLENLKLSEQDAKYLVKRQGYYSAAVVNAVRVLKQFEIVDRNVIRKYTSVNDSIPIYEIFNYLLQLPECKIDYQTAVKLVYQYRFAFDHLRSYVLSTCDLYKQVFMCMVDGQLSIKNYKSYKSDSDKKFLQNMSDYQLQKIVTQFSSISLEYLYLIEQTVKGIPSDTTGIPSFVTLLKTIK